MNLLRDIWMIADIDQDGYITQEELRASLHEKQVLEAFEELGLKETHAGEVFQLLDSDGAGKVDVAHFLEGMMRMKRGLGMDIIYLVSRRSEATMKVSLRNEERIEANQHQQMANQQILEANQHQ